MMRYELSIFTMFNSQVVIPLNMQVVVLAGGSWISPRPWTNDIPKPLYQCLMLHFSKEWLKVCHLI